MDTASIATAASTATAPHAAVRFPERDEHLRELDDLLSTTFNAVLRTEEQAIRVPITEGLTITEIHTIVAVGLHERNTMGTVAARLNVALGTLTASMNKLVSKGYVDRFRDENDRRRVLVSLTRRGRAVYRVHALFHRKMTDEALQGLTDEEERVLSSALSKVKAYFERQLA